ncbi:MAG: phosphate ABC transporter substrate-binding protein PstS [Burkholderiaceae bacterium]
MKLRISIVAVCAFTLLPLTVWAQKTDIKGAGASFPSTVYTTWAFAYSKEAKTTVSYAASGSGEGIKRISSREVDFGATDNPLTTEDLKKNGLMQFPTLVGGIVPVVNLRGIAPGKLKLTGAVLADIYEGKINSWRDPKIVALNPALDLPARDIIRIVREDASGSTASFTDYLSKASQPWARKAGSATLLKWPAPVVAAKGTDGVMKTMQETAGAIAYVSFDRVMKNNLTYALLQNRNGQFVAPSEASFQAAVKASDLGRSGVENASLIDLAGQDVWPITDTTYVLVESAPKTASKSQAVLKFFYWAFLKGDEIIAGTGFAALPVDVQARVVRRLAEVRSENGDPINLLSLPGDTQFARQMLAASGS